MEVKQPMTRLSIERRYWADDREADKEVFEGEVNMSQEQQDAYQQIVGDGQAHVTVSRTMSEKDFGSGGECFVSVSLTVDQSARGLESGISYAKYLAENKLGEHFGEMQNELRRRGIIKPGR